MKDGLKYILGAAGLLLLTIGMACADEISGKVTLPDGRPAKDAVVYLEGGAVSTPIEHAMVDQRQKTFIPHVSVVTRGTTVRFPNDDTIFHNVFAYYQAKKFDLGMYPRGASKSVTFDKPGLVDILCNVHSEMSAFIMVVDTPYYAVTDSSGHFQIAHVPPGKYTLHGWHETGAKKTEALEITAGQTPLDVKLQK